MIQSEWLSPLNLTEDSHKIYEDIKDKVKCPVCLDLLNDPVECTKCTGTICRVCNDIQEERQCCKMLGPSIFEVKLYLDSLKFQCANRTHGCNQESIYSNLITHINECKQKLQCNDEPENFTHTNENSEIKHAKENETNAKRVKESSRGGMLVAELERSGHYKIRKVKDSSSQTAKIRIRDVFHKNTIFSAKISPDGLKLATGSEDNTARVTDLISGTSIATINHNSTIQSVAFSEDGTQLATGSADDTARVTDLTDNTTKITVNHQSSIQSVAFSPNSIQLATGSKDHTARVTNVIDGSTVFKFDHNSQVQSVAFSPDGLLLATGSNDYTARVTDMISGNSIATTGDANQDAGVSKTVSVYSVAFSPCSLLLATGTDNTARVQDLKNYATVIAIEHNSFVYSVAFSPDGLLLATGSDDSTARVTEILSGKIIANFEHYSAIVSVEFSQDGSKIILAGKNGIAKIYDI